MIKENIFSARSLLFVPGNRPERYHKAISSGADSVCIDLEDAVAPHQKDIARRALLQELSSGKLNGNIGIRINPVDSRDGLFDLNLLVQMSDLGRLPDFILLPKATSSSHVEMISSIVAPGKAGIIPLIESSRGLNACHELAQAEGVVALMFGGADFSVDIRAKFVWNALVFARQKIVAAAALGKIPAIDVPFIHVDDPAGLARETSQCIESGFSCKAAIHPAQIRIIHDAFAPTEEELAYANRVMKAMNEANGGAIVVDGKLVDAPIVESARRVLVLSGR